MNTNTTKLSERGLSIWLDSLSRDIMQNGQLQKLMAEDSVVGVTTNPTIFNKAVSESSIYDFSGFDDAETAVKQLTTEDVRAACDIFMPVYTDTMGIDGHVSIEVDPRFAYDELETRASAEELSRLVGRENVMIKIPATTESLGAITDTLSKGISVNVTLIFSVNRYIEVMQAFVAGLKKAYDKGLDLRKIHSVASFFVSRIDAAVDPILTSKNSPEADALKGRVAITECQLAYLTHGEFFAKDEVWQRLKAAGAHPQRLLWASTGVKNNAYSPTLYVDSLAFAGTVNTMPPETLAALEKQTNSSLYPSLPDKDVLEQRMKNLSDVGINFIEVAHKLESEGVQKFVSSWNELLRNVSIKLGSNHQ
ncbi:MAG: transaldolase [Candidatus Nomurabacteria bacterium]|jgi:transaldolase|nr:transaldolase [Candidatus Nomurabacteria bacterium]